MSTLVVTIPATCEPERRYIAEVMLREFLGLDFVLEVGAVRDTTLAIGKRRLVIRDTVFADEGYLAERNVPRTAGEASDPVTGAPVAILFGTDELVVTGDELRCGIDVFASAFFMLTRWEETVARDHDVHGRFLAEHSLAQRTGLLGRCIVNEWVELLWNLLVRLGCTQPRRARRFSVATSHDVDYPRHWTVRTGVVTTGGDLLRRRSPRQAIRTARSFVASRLGWERDPYDTFDWLMDRSEEHGVVSHFNFMTGRWSEHDPPFDYRPRALAPLIDRVVRRGHRVGFHPSYNAYRDPVLWRREQQRLEVVSPQPVKTGREHYLRFAAPLTWRIWDDHGMEWDSTLGYADREGFRCGTCYEFPVFDVERRRALRLRERPLIAMDATLVSYRGLGPEATHDALEAVRAECKKYDGELVLLWHNSNLSGRWEPYREVYARALRA